MPDGRNWLHIKLCSNTEMKSCPHFTHIGRYWSSERDHGWHKVCIYYLASSPPQSTLFKVHVLLMVCHLKRTQTLLPTYWEGIEPDCVHASIHSGESLSLGTDGAVWAEEWQAFLSGRRIVTCQHELPSTIWFLWQRTRLWNHHTAP